ncbi:MAG: hypothetical protein KC609_09010 [Myxococcales bacterium]|nr:hypothetical protein [Myxococcales bacterium]
MTELFGSKEKCLYCQKREMSNSLEVIEEEKGSGKQYQMFVCSPECETALRAFMSFAESKRWHFIGALLGWLILSGLGAILGSVVHRSFILVATLATAGFGVAVWMLPFVTPQTIELFGVKRGIVIGKIGGVVLAVVGLGSTVALLL